MTTPAVPDPEDAALVNNIIDGMALQTTIAELETVFEGRRISPCARLWAACRRPPAFRS